ncbi:MAG: T9SS type A sorting domain-containing protein, partial [Bacteroidota bacterium]
FLIPYLLCGQGGLFIGNGVNMVLLDEPQIVIEDGQFNNDGDFSGGKSTVHFKGAAKTENSIIGGSSVTVFNNLKINKSNNDVRLDHDVDVDGDLIMKGGNFILNKSDVNLGGSIIGETATKRITGTTGGAIIKTVGLNMPVAENPGNIGLEITSVENLGSTLIHRRHTQLTNNGNHSIYRCFDISPGNNVNLDATLRIHYFDEELAGLNEDDLEIWHFNGANWTSQNVNSKNIADNWVEASGYGFFHTVTVAEEMNLPLPVELIDFNVKVNEQEEVDVFWSTANEINSGYFIVGRSHDGLNFNEIKRVSAAGNSAELKYYKIIDRHPFSGINYYRLKQIDLDGSYFIGPVRTAVIYSDAQFAVFPNPVINVLNIEAAAFEKEEELVVEIFDANGKILYRKNSFIGDGNQLIKIDEVSDFMAGNYFLVLKTSSGNHAYNLIKVRE